MTPYHQDERDRAVAVGCLTLVAFAALAVGLVIGTLVWIWQP